ncbi:MAG: diaminopimelate decarboxylase [Deltaproteobacteria bacterium]|nr:diaminopimelate decarboxylase [Deltaproteobacteria bacterium]
MEERENQLFLGDCPVEALAEAFGTPLYVYEEEVIRRQAREFKQSFAGAPVDLHYAMKANSNPAILRILKAEGLGAEAVSPFELRLALEAGFAPETVLFTGNNLDAGDLRYAIGRNVNINIGSLKELDLYGRLNPGGRVGLRINPDVGAGHHHHVITGGPASKFGIYHDQGEAIRELLTRHQLRLVGIHSHIGTGILRTEDMMTAMEIVCRTAQDFPDLEFVDFGGGFGIPYRPDQQPLPLKELGQAMTERFRVFCADYGKELRMKLEPGRYMVAQAGTLLARVTNISSTPRYTFIGTDSGFNHLIRPALYGAYHEVVNATAVRGEKIQAVVAGNICESGDVFTQNADGLEPREITRPEVGHLLAVLDAGAYGMSLASSYNLRPRPAEILVENGLTRLIRRRETYEDMVRNLVSGERPFSSE